MLNRTNVVQITLVLLVCNLFKIVGLCNSLNINEND